MWQWFGHLLLDMVSKHEFAYPVNNDFFGIKRKKPTWPNPLLGTATSAYSFTSLPTGAGCPSLIIRVSHHCRLSGHESQGGDGPRSQEQLRRDCADIRHEAPDERFAINASSYTPLGSARLLRNRAAISRPFSGSMTRGSVTGQHLQSRILFP